MKAPQHIKQLGAKEQIKIIRKEIKKVAPKVSVRMGRGTAWGWVDISGSASEWGIFTDEEREALTELGIRCGANCANISPDDRDWWVAKLTGQLIPETREDEVLRSCQQMARFG